MIFYFSKIDYFLVALNIYLIGGIISRAEGQAINKHNEEFFVVITEICVSTHFFFLLLKNALQLFIHEVKEMVLKLLLKRLGTGYSPTKKFNGF